MKKFVIILAIFFTTTSLKAFDWFYLGLDYSKQFSEDKNFNADVFSLDFKVFINSSVSLNYSISYGHSLRRSFFKIPSGPIIGYDLFMFARSLEDDEEDNDELLGAASIPSFLLLLLPEGISYHTELSRYLSLEFTVNPFQYYYYQYSENLCSSLGVKFNYFVEKIIISPHLNLDILWSENIYPTLGVSVGYRF